METARALTENLASLLRREHTALAEFLVALADFDRRRAWVELGYSSLFYFLHRELRLSLGAAQHRKVAAELIQQVPGVIEPLRRGQLCLTSIIEVSKVVTAENWETVLPRFYGLSRREAMDVVAELQPHPAPPVRTVVTQVRSGPNLVNDAPASRALGEAGEPRLLDGTDGVSAGAPLGPISPGEMGRVLTAPRDTAAAFAASATSVTPATTGTPVTPPPALATPATPARSFEVVPLTADQSRVHLTVSKAFMRKLEAARDAMSNAMPGATHAEILEAGLELLLAQAAKRKGMVEKPRKQVRQANGDHVPAHVKREVWKRDGGRCQWPLDSGGICSSTRHLELDHIHPRSTGGLSTAANLRVLCRAHNDLAARRALGNDLMDRYSSGLRGAARRPRSAGANDEASALSPP